MATPLRLIGMVLLAVALAAAVWAGWRTPLGAVLFRIDAALLNTLQAGTQRHVAPWLWDDVALPLLERPAWLVPAVLGLLLLLPALLARARGRRPRA
jgi:hypothetical protein